LSVQLNKSDRGDARGLAEMIRVGWFKAVQVKSLNAHERKALLIARHQLVDMRVRIDNQLRGILKTFGLVIGKCGRGHIGQRAAEPVSPPQKLEKSEQRPAPETRVQWTEMPENPANREIYRELPIL
jgi:transposase